MKKKYVVFASLLLVLAVFLSACFLKKEESPTAPSTLEISDLDSDELAYVQVNLSMYDYVVTPQKGTCRLYTEDEDDRRVINWIIENFSGSYAFSQLYSYNTQVSGDSNWHSIAFYNKEDELLDKISWRVLDHGNYLTPNPASTLTFLYENDIDWEFYDFFLEYNRDYLEAQEWGVDYEDYIDSLFIAGDKTLILEVNDREFEVRMWGNPATKELFSRLPLTVEMTDEDGWLKTVELEGTFPHYATENDYYIGDLMLHGDHCLVFTYEEHDRKERFTRLGYIMEEETEGLTEVMSGDTVTVTLRKKQQNKPFDRPE